MSEVLYQEVKPPYKIVVDKVKEDAITLVVSEVTVLAGVGNIVNSYQDAEFATEQGKLFARNLGLAVEAGYYLSSRLLVHPSGKKLHVSNALDTDRSEDNFRALLETGE